MSFKVITVISDPNTEDKVIEALSSESTNISILYRAHSLEGLERFSSNSVDAISNVVLIHDGIEDQLGDNHLLNYTASLNIAALDTSNSVLLRSGILTAIRKQESTHTIQSSIVKRANHIAVTGSSASPGITTLAINIADELSQTDMVRIIDLDPWRRDIAYLLGSREGMEPIRITERLRIELASEEPTKGFTLLDLGACPNVINAMTDRRQVTKDFVTWIESSEVLVYVTKPEPTLFPEIATFVANLGRRDISTKTFFVINQIGRTPQDKVGFKRLQKLLEGYEYVICEEDRDASRISRAQHSALRQIAPRSRLRKSMEEAAQMVTHLLSSVRSDHAARHPSRFTDRSL